MPVTLSMVSSVPIYTKFKLEKITRKNNSHNPIVTVAPFKYCFYPEHELIFALDINFTISFSIILLPELTSLF
jgi:hypothetical protein